MDKINFGTTYRIQLKPNADMKNTQLKKFVSQFQNHLYSNANSNTGTVRVSVRKRLDNRVEQGIKRLGFDVYQKFGTQKKLVTDASGIKSIQEFERHNIPTSKMDDFIKEQLNAVNYTWVGKQNPKKPKIAFQD